MLILVKIPKNSIFAPGNKKTGPVAQLDRATAF
jgi:hypothetical protein